MTDEEFVLSILGIVAGTAMVGIIFGGIFSVIKTWINRKNKSAASDLDPQFFRALSEFKRKTEHRLSNLEAIVTDTDENQDKISSAPEIEIEIESENTRKKEEKKEDGNLRNMLNE